MKNLILFTLAVLIAGLVTRVVMHQQDQTTRDLIRILNPALVSK